MAGVVHVDDRELHTEHSNTTDSDNVERQLEVGEPDAVIVGKKRQIVGILVSISLAQSSHGLICLLGFAIRHHDPFPRHRFNTSDNVGPRVQCVVSLSWLDRCRA